MVYSKFFGRIPAINNQYIVDFFINHDIKLFYLWNEHLDYMRRGPKDRIIYDAKDYSRLKTLFERAFTTCTELENAQNAHFQTINTSEYNIEQSINLIKEQLWNKTKITQ